MGAQELLCALSLCLLKDMQWFRCSYPVQGGETELVALAPLGSCHGMLQPEAAGREALGVPPCSPPNVPLSNPTA